MTSEPSPPRGRLARGARLAALPAALAGRTAVGLGKRVAGHSAEAVAAQVQQRTAEQLFATLGRLKGGAMKVGQAMSAMEAALPEQLAGPYRESLARLQESAPPMPATLVHQRLDRAFPGGWRDVLRDLDDRPVAAASVGQVHRATWTDGTAVAVKVQYPGAAEALLTDVGTLSALVPVMRAAAPGLDARQLVTELRDRLVAEVDYEQEARAQSAFAAAYRDDPDIAVPDVLAVARPALVSRWVDGTPLSQVIAAGRADERDRAGLLLVRLLASAPERARLLHGDPHPGNFRLLPDGRLAVLDFGATEALPGGWPAGLGPLLAAGRDGDAARLHRTAAAAGLLQDGVTPAALLDLLDDYFAPLRSPVYTFDRAWLRAQTQRVSDPLGAPARTQRRLSVPPRHLMLQRVVAGLVGVLCSLGASVAVDAEVRRWVPGYRPLPS
ncbi:ABC1 kinase family protein [Modestobacter roseus]|uniref:Putative unusual protein kinase regulating ubiquinone biosynthesis (AarF/ABC1/UbiB family) n=1 Tax=Modestobacter roseus TaxID=1181884 RepID=A0A562IQ09_9ACTN|nr:AarF/ABC1/UbiB kinase family protein [Modestobacter roseus]MQA35688.1 AarF/ABC1/UbiB kinase family protein [Modestobacter roseus]TWH72896.1 putative unusual protein kinase regulating ubiquinone biosynthesis (AarF/ABC1/UbiB family) [Modestobacter roseus]